MDGFCKLGFLHCIGAVDETHILIGAPKAQAGECVNRKHTFSLLLQGDHMGRFTSITTGYSGKHHDAFIFKESSFCATMDAGVFVPCNLTIRLGGGTIPPTKVGLNVHLGGLNLSGGA